MFRGSAGNTPFCQWGSQITMPEKTFHCLRCGKCCCWPGYVRISEAEIEAIARFLQLEEMEFTADYTVLMADRTGLSLIEDAAEHCIFWDENSGCRIQPVKPRQCREFPTGWNFPGWERECAAGKLLYAKES